MADTDPQIARIGVAIAFALMWYHSAGHQGAELISLNNRALEVSRRLGDEKIAAEALGHVATGLQLVRRLEEAIEHLEQQLALCAQLGDRFGELRALGNLANVHLTRERYDRVLQCAERQLVIAQEIGTGVGTRHALGMLGIAYVELGMFQKASPVLDEVLASAESDGDLSHQCTAHRPLGELHLRKDDPETARNHFRTALALCRMTGHRSWEIYCLIQLSQACRRLDDLDSALGYITQAVPLADDLGADDWQRKTKEEHAAVHEALASPITRPTTGDQPHLQ